MSAPKTNNESLTSEDLGVSVANRRRFTLNKVFVISFLVLLVLVMLFGYFFWRSKFTQFDQKAVPVDISKIKFPSDELKNRFDGNLDVVNNEPDPQKRYELLQDLFSKVIGVYSQNREPATRVEVQKLLDYIKNYYPREAEKQVNLYKLPCFDNECGNASYDSEMEGIKKKVVVIEILDREVVDNINREIDTAAFLETGSRWVNYYNVFQLLKQQYQKTKNEKVKTLAEEVRSYLENNFPERYGLIGRNDPNSFELGVRL